MDARPKAQLYALPRVGGFWSAAHTALEGDGGLTFKAGSGSDVGVLAKFPYGGPFGVCSYAQILSGASLCAGMTVTNKQTHLG